MVQLTSYKTDLNTDMFSFSEIVDITGGKTLASNYDGVINHFLTDSRKLINPKESVFVAIRGVHHDGHQYVQQLFRRGVRQFIIEKEEFLHEEVSAKSNILLVPASIGALQKIAAHHRSKYQIPVIGITGSNGKTIVKEWLGQLLSTKFRIVKSPKSYNSQLGVPLSVLQMTDWNDLAIFEAGISTVHEMEHLQRVIQPTLGIFTNIGTAHDEGFADKRQKALEKWKLFSKCACVIYCLDHDIVQQTQPTGLNVLTWGFDNIADVKILDKSKSTQTLLKLSYKGEIFNVSLPFTEEVLLENAMHCISTMLYLNFGVDEISASFQHLTNLEGRLSLKHGLNNCYLIDDSYNNDLAGLQIAIDFMKNQPGNKLSVILSDILQTGLEDEVLFPRLNQILVDNDITSFIGIGEGMMKNQKAFTMNGSFFDSTDHFLKSGMAEKFQNEKILIKGARKYEFEKITNFLSEKIHGTVLEINLDALNENLNFYRSQLNNGVKLMVMVKASAYGSGSHEIANLLQHNRVDYLAVAYPDEGVTLRKQGIHMPIMVMNVAPENYANILKFDLEPEIYSLGQLRSLINFAGAQGSGLKVHLKLDSGMHRLGFEDYELSELTDMVIAAPQISVESIYSHLAGADDEQHNDFSKEQVDRFLSMASKIEKALQIQPLRHILNSAGILRFPQYQFDMVRLGIGLYGFEANQLNQSELQPISTLKTIISQVRKVKKGETIGYGRKGLATRDCTIATIAIGYADGFSRAFSNGKVSLRVKGQLAPVIGNVCMDMTMLDITGIAAREGDEVIVFGANPTIKQLADAIGTIPHEILTSISSRVNRVFYSS
jgi:alanine racemase